MLTVQKRSKHAAGHVGQAGRAKSKRRAKAAVARASRRINRAAR
jgi:hypothetical protein